MFYCPDVVLHRAQAHPLTWHYSVLSCFPFYELISNCSAAGCQDNCAVTRTGPKCYCKSGFEIGPDGKTCKGLSATIRTPCCHMGLWKKCVSVSSGRIPPDAPVEPTDKLSGP
ncbi:hypothetical protein NFI96_001323 [Prochilodus magdalenae]|nr:hypothetical protein NFI96_001323 [Prochilodus magdalenae]